MYETSQRMIVVTFDIIPKKTLGDQNFLKCVI